MYFSENLGRRNGSSFNSFTEYGLPEIKRRYFSQNKVEYIDNNGFEITDCDLDGRPLRMNGYFSNNPPNAILARLDPR